MFAPQCFGGKNCRMAGFLKRAYSQSVVGIRPVVAGIDVCPLKGSAGVRLPASQERTGRCSPRWDADQEAWGGDLGLGKGWRAWIRCPARHERAYVVRPKRSDPLSRRPACLSRPHAAMKQTSRRRKGRRRAKSGTLRELEGEEKHAEGCEGSVGARLPSSEERTGRCSPRSDAQRDVWRGKVRSAHRLARPRVLRGEEGEEA